ncbi:hypothetical protein M427DRAFT_145897 [Gonapodya prolifera JEL478]|uniref:mRNA stability protein n=1 Tax=Gonapodya prolifera (strain JEL478) TaxID=1344416 RepID=A0A139AE57_GONPJ|nr:hypothetical protein M427DRAFT_145897 [Gonapodya prolifera JEL478]|eukprot:KXS14703.1 hypothetical protein M427DRAFT_145897 [Gonapodya prolifera JEL478]
MQRPKPAAKGPPVDVSKLSEEERVFYQKYGRLPPKKGDLLAGRLKGSDRKFFDSGDYALSQAGRAKPSDVGSAHPVPDRIPHSVPAHLQVAQPGHAAVAVPAQGAPAAQGVNGSGAGAGLAKSTGRESGLAKEQKEDAAEDEEMA